MDLTPFRERLSEYLALHGVRTHNSDMSKCPLKHHLDDTRPSFSTGGTGAGILWHCFGCEEGGDIFDFASIYHGLPGRGETGFYEVTLIQIAAQLGIEYVPPKRSIEKHKDRFDYYTALRHIIGQLTLHPVEQFIKDRGWNIDVAKRFQVGALRNSKSTLGALKREIPEKFLKSVGILTDQGNPAAFLSEKRIIFPLFNQYGAPIGINARLIDEGKSNQAKYINSRNNSFFKKGNVLYNFHRAKRRTDSVFVVEGPTDVISLSSSGVDNVVGLSGTAISDVQVKMLSSIDTVTFVLDSDEAGIKAGKRALTKLPDAYVKLLPHGIDPDQLVREQGIEAFHDLDYLTKLEFEIEVDPYQNKREATIQYISRIFHADPLDHARLISRLSKKTGYDRIELAQSLARKMNKSAIQILNKAAEKAEYLHISILPQRVEPNNDDEETL